MKMTTFMFFYTPRPNQMWCTTSTKVQKKEKKEKRRKKNKKGRKKMNVFLQEHVLDPRGESKTPCTPKKSWSTSGVQIDFYNYIMPFHYCFIKHTMCSSRYLNIYPAARLEVSTVLVLQTTFIITSFYQLIYNGNILLFCLRQ